MRALLTAAAAGLIALTLGACGGSAAHHVAHQLPAPQASAPPPPTVGLPAPGPTNVPASAAQLSVIRGWADTLRHGDLAGAARLFALPSVLVNGADSSGRATVIHIRSLRDAVAANATLSCGAELLSADVRGPYVNALFRLTDRVGLGGGCGMGIGQNARTNFVISHGRIVQWLRAPSDPGDGGGGANPTVPSPAQQSGSPAV